MPSQGLSPSARRQTCDLPERLKFSTPATLQAVPFSTLATRKATSPPDLHQAGRDLLDHAVDRRPVALAAGRHAVDAALHDPDIALPGDGDVTGLGALHLGVAAPARSCARSAKSCASASEAISVRSILGMPAGSGEAQPGGRRALLARSAPGRRRRGIVGVDGCCCCCCWAAALPASRTRTRTRRRFIIYGLLHQGWRRRYFLAHSSVEQQASTGKPERPPAAARRAGRLRRRARRSSRAAPGAGRS